MNCKSKLVNVFYIHITVKSIFIWIVAQAVVHVFILISLFTQALILPGIRIIRFENSLFSINVEHFRNNLYKNTTNPKKLKLAIKKAKSRHAKQMKAEKNAQSKVSIFFLSVFTVRSDFLYITWQCEEHPNSGVIVNIIDIIFDLYIIMQSKIITLLAIANVPLLSL